MIARSPDQRPPAHHVLGHPFFWSRDRQLHFLEVLPVRPITLISLFLVSHFNFLFILCGRLSWLPVSFLLHVKYTLSYRIVSTGSCRSVVCEFCGTPPALDAAVNFNSLQYCTLHRSIRSTTEMLPLKTGRGCCTQLHTRVLLTHLLFFNQFTTKLQQMH